MPDLLKTGEPDVVTYPGLGSIEDIRIHVIGVLARDSLGLAHAVEEHFGVVEALEHIVSPYTRNFSVRIQKHEEGRLIYHRFKVNVKLEDLVIEVPLATHFALEMYYNRYMGVHHDVADEVYTKFGPLAVLPILAAAGFPYPYDQNGETHRLLSVYPEDGCFKGIVRPQKWWESISTHVAGVKASILEKRTYRYAGDLYNAMNRSHHYAYPQVSKEFWTEPTEKVEVKEGTLTIIIPSTETQQDASANYKRKGHRLPSPRPMNGAIVTAWLNVRGLSPYPATWREGEEDLKSPLLTGATADTLPDVFYEH